MPLDATVIRNALRATAARRLLALEVFPEIDSTNSYLIEQPAPAPGRLRVALTDNQTAGRGRHGRTWLSPPGSGLCLSLSYTFASSPPNLPALTLAVGLQAIDALQELGIDEVQLKWPNDLIASDRKLGGILTEARTQSDGALTVVTGIGLNVDLGEQADRDFGPDGALRAIDLKQHAIELPALNALAAGLLNGLIETLADFETEGLAMIIDRWRSCDWLLGKEVRIDTPSSRIHGVGAGIAEDGSLLIDTPLAGRCRITSGTVVAAGYPGTNS